jgi:hypothetical protein
MATLQDALPGELPHETARRIWDEYKARLAKQGLPFVDYGPSREGSECCRNRHNPSIASGGTVERCTCAGCF